jgi:Ca2+-binding RTX toxin-like protein
MSKTALRRFLIIGAAVAATATAGLVAVPAFAAQTAGTVKADFWGIEFTAATGATNKISAGGTKDPILFLADENNEITLDASAEGRCVQVTKKSVRCTDVTTATFNLGDKNDTYTNTNGYVTTFIRAGSGNDTLDASLASDPMYLFGESGNDKLIGGAGPDTLDAGSGIQQSTNGGKGEDTCRGNQVIRTSCEW